MTTVAPTRTKRKVLVGWVISDKMDKTRVVEVRWSKQDPKYKKIRYLSTNLHVHDEKNEAKMGDLISIMATKPISKKKRWRMMAILPKS